jgi:hypothetical protein
MFRKGHRLFSIAAIALLIVAILQATGFFSPPPDDLLYSGLAATLQSYIVDLGLGRPSMMEIFDSQRIAIAILLAWVAIVSLAVARYATLRDKVVRKSCSFNLIGIAALVALFVYYQALPLAIALGIVEILFVVARFRLRSGRIIHVDPHVESDPR